MNIRQINLVTIALMLAQFICPIGNLATAQTVDPKDFSTPCKATLFDIERELESYKTVYVSDVHAGRISSQNTNGQTNRSVNLFFSLDAYDSVWRGDAATRSSALDILNSPNLLRSYTTRIVQSCDTIGSVNFMMTEYQFRQFGLSNNNVVELRCSGICRR